MLRRKNIVVLFMVLILTIAIFAVLSINSTRKGGEGTGMFEVNSNSLSIYVNDTKKTYSDKEQNEIVARRILKLFPIWTVSLTNLSI